MLTLLPFRLYMNSVNLGGVAKMAIITELERSPSSEQRVDNPYLNGIHAPIDEEMTIEQLEVTGTIPAALDGRYLRIGPNPIVPDPATHHWFTGDGMVHGLRLQQGRALWYRNRWVRSAGVSAALGEAP